MKKGLAMQNFIWKLRIKKNRDKFGWENIGE